MSDMFPGLLSLTLFSLFFFFFSLLSQLLLTSQFAPECRRRTSYTVHVLAVCGLLVFILPLLVLHPYDVIVNHDVCVLCDGNVTYSCCALN